MTVFAVLNSLPGSGVSIPISAAGGLLLLSAGLMLRRLSRSGGSGPARAAPAPTRPAVASTAPAPNPNRVRSPSIANATPSTTATLSVPDIPLPRQAAGPSMGPRLLSEDAIGAFARTLERSRRLAAAEDRVAGELGELSSGHWLVERRVVIADQRVPFVVAGPTGVFLLAATDGAWDIPDLVALSQLAPRVRERLPVYAGGIQVGVCLAFDEMAPRTWYAGAEGRGHGGWIVGLDWLVRWLHSLDCRGLETGDIDALQTAAHPVWTRRTTARLPHVRNFG